MSSSALSTPLENNSVVLKVIARIREALINKELRPGDYLPSEENLARNLGVGKSSVREAVKMLQAMGLADVRRGQGTVIRERPGEDILEPMIFQLILQDASNADLIDLRMMFEPAYNLIAMERATPEDMARVEQTVSVFERAVARGEQTADDDIAFHIAILQATHNPYVIRIGETILELFRASINRSMREIPDTAVRDHKAILAAFQAKDRERLQAAIIKSFEGWEHSLARQAQEKPDEASSGA